MVEAAVVFLILYVLTLCSVARPRLRPWFGILTAIVVNIALTGFAFLPGKAAYGADFARLFALGLLVLSSNPAIAKAGDMAMRRLSSQRAEVFSHWGTVLHGIQFSAQEFYERVEGTIQERQWPGVELIRISYTEAGILSHNREYLRVIRHRQVFDICAAQFGKDYFFTLREAEIKAQVTLATFVILLMALAMVFGIIVSVFGMTSGLMTFGSIIVIGPFLLFNALRMGLTRLDGLLLRTPVIGPVYETWFRRSTTYFQHDTRVIFLKLMDDLVKEGVDEETSAQGIKHLSCFEHQPIFDGFYKTSTRHTAGAESQ
jgi:hypothetical protein